MPPEDGKRRLVLKWIEKAEHDLLAAERAVSGIPSLRDVAAFHWQQAAEKVLKAFLAQHDVPFVEHTNCGAY